MLWHFVSPSQEDWDLKLPCAKFAYNNATGFTPFELNYGRHPRGPFNVTLQTIVPDATEFVEKVNDALSCAQNCLRSAQARMKKPADTKRRDMEFAIGDQVLLSTKYLRVLDGTRKLAHKWIGPFPIVRRIGKQLTSWTCLKLCQATSVKFSKFVNENLITATLTHRRCLYPIFKEPSRSGRLRGHLTIGMSRFLQRAVALRESSLSSGLGLAM